MARHSARGLPSTFEARFRGGRVMQLRDMKVRTIFEVNQMQNMYLWENWRLTEIGLSQKSK